MTKKLPHCEICTQWGSQSVSERKGWYVYDGSVWRPDKGNLKVSELAKLLADKLYVFALTITEEDARKRFIDRVRKLQLRKNREAMLKDAMSVYPISMQAFDRNKYLFNCKNGTLDMQTLEFREHRPEDYLTMESDITYDPKADCPRWHSFIKEVMCGDKDLADFGRRLPEAGQSDRSLHAGRQLCRLWCHRPEAGV